MEQKNKQRDLLGPNMRWIRTLPAAQSKKKVKELGQQGDHKVGGEKV